MSNNQSSSNKDNSREKIENEISKHLMSLAKINEEKYQNEKLNELKRNFSRLVDDTNELGEKLNRYELPVQSEPPNSENRDFSELLFCGYLEGDFSERAADIGNPISFSGGFFLRSTFANILFDPGMNTLNGLRDMDVNLREEVDIIIVSHYHPSARFDLHVILNILGGFCPNRAESTLNEAKQIHLFSSQAVVKGRNDHPPVLIPSDLKVIKSFHNEEKKEVKGPIVAKWGWRYLVTKSDDGRCEVEVLAENREPTIGELIITAHPAFHSEAACSDLEDDIDGLSGTELVCYQLETTEWSLLFTGDTEFPLFQKDRSYYNLYDFVPEEMNLYVEILRDYESLLSDDLKEDLETAQNNQSIEAQRIHITRCFNHLIRQDFLDLNDENKGTEGDSTLIRRIQDTRKLLSNQSEFSPKKRKHQEELFSLHRQLLNSRHNCLSRINKDIKARMCPWLDEVKVLGSKKPNLLIANMKTLAYRARHNTENVKQSKVTATYRWAKLPFTYNQLGWRGTVELVSKLKPNHAIVRALGLECAVEEKDGKLHYASQNIALCRDALARATNYLGTNERQKIIIPGRHRVVIRENRMETQKIVPAFVKYGVRTYGKGTSQFITMNSRLISEVDKAKNLLKKKEERAFITIQGPSGGGKTLLANAIASEILCDGGYDDDFLHFNSEDFNEDSTNSSKKLDEWIGEIGKNESIKYPKGAGLTQKLNSLINDFSFDDRSHQAYNKRLWHHVRVDHDFFVKVGLFKDNPDLISKIKKPIPAYYVTRILRKEISTKELEGSFDNFLPIEIRMDSIETEILIKLILDEFSGSGDGQRIKSYQKEFNRRILEKFYPSLPRIPFGSYIRQLDLAAIDEAGQSNLFINQLLGWPPKFFNSSDPGMKGYLSVPGFLILNQLEKLNPVKGKHFLDILENWTFTPLRSNIQEPVKPKLIFTVNVTFEELGRRLPSDLINRLLSGRIVLESFDNLSPEQKRKDISHFLRFWSQQNRVMIETKAYQYLMNLDLRKGHFRRLRNILELSLNRLRSEYQIDENIQCFLPHRFLEEGIRSLETGEFDSSAEGQKIANIQGRILPRVNPTKELAWIVAIWISYKCADKQAYLRIKSEDQGFIGPNPFKRKLKEFVGCFSGPMKAFDFLTNKKVVEHLDGTKEGLVNYINTLVTDTNKERSKPNEIFDLTNPRLPKAERGKDLKNWLGKQCEVLGHVLKNQNLNSQKIKEKFVERSGKL